MGTLKTIQRFIQPRARLLLLLCLIPLTSRAAPQNPREYAIKAAYLFHFTQFIEWPAHALPAPNEPIRIGVLQPNPFGTLLEEIVNGQRVDDRPIEIDYLDDIRESTAQYQIIFVARTAHTSPEQVLEIMAGEPVLLIGETIEFLQSGGMIALLTEQDRVLIAANRTALQQAGLSASARLLRLARLVEGSTGS